MTTEEQILEQLRAIAKFIGAPVCKPPMDPEKLAEFDKKWREVREAALEKAQEERAARGKSDDMDDEDREEHGVAWMNE